MEGFKVIIDFNKMFVNIIAEDNIVDEIATKEELLHYLNEKSIVKGIDYIEIDKAFNELHSLKKSEKYTIVWGKTAIDGKDAEVKFTTDVSGKVYYDNSLKNTLNSVDYKEAIKISRVRKGEIIGIINPPTEGKKGYNIEGKEVHAKDGKDINIALGHGACFSPKRDKIIATQEGRPVIINDKISVEPVYEVHGDVCFETGNIDFNGHVYISGSVQDDFTVKANSIEIRGSVGASHIIAQNDLVIVGGVNGHFTGQIICNGDAYVKYLNDANAEIRGDLKVKKGIINSVAKSLGQIIARKIIGGKIIALKGILTNTIGSEMGVETSLKVGVNYEIEALNHALDNLSKQIENITLRLKDKLGDREYFKKVTPKIQKRIIFEYRAFKEIRKGYLKILAKKSSLVHDDRLLPDSEVIIMDTLHTDVTVSTTICHKEFIYEFSGPIKLVENLSNKSMRIKTFDINNDKMETDDNIDFKNVGEIKYTDEKCTLRYDYFGGVRYTKEGILELERKFAYMIYGQKFSICIAHDKHITRITIVKELKNAGFDNVFDVENHTKLFEVMKQHQNKPLIIICNSSFSRKNGVKLLIELLHYYKNSYGVIMHNKYNIKLIKAAEKIKHLDIISGAFSIQTFKKIVKKFDIH